MGIAHLVERTHSMQEALGSLPRTSYTCKARIWEMETVTSVVQGHPCLHLVLKVSGGVGHLRFCLKNKRNKK